MHTMVSFINLFFVPVLPLWLCGRKEGKAPQASLDMLFRYCLSAAVLVPATKAVLFLPSLILQNSVPTQSGYYTIAALAAAWLLHFLARRLIWLSRHVSIQVDLGKITWPVQIERIPAREQDSAGKE